MSQLGGNSYNPVKEEPIDPEKPSLNGDLRSAANPTPQTTRYSDFRLTWVPRTERGNAKHHIIKFHSNKTINPAQSFVPPIKMQRKDPNATQNTPAEQPLVVEGPSSSAPAVNIASIAPYGGAQNMKQNAFKRKTRQVVKVDPQARRLQEEELCPWIMEDFDGKNTWASTMEGGQSSSFVLFMFSENGFKVIPVDRFYRFNQKSNFQALTIDEAEAKMNKKTPIPRWFMKKEAPGPDGDTGPAAPMYKLKTVPNAKPVHEPRVPGSDEELDFEEDFADDEDVPLIEGNEEDNKKLEEKIKREMLTANLFGEADPEVELEDQDSNRPISREGKKLQRYLKLLEKNNAYESDDEDENPYASDEESDSEQEVVKEEEEMHKKEEKMKNRFGSGTHRSATSPPASKRLERSASGSMVPTKSSTTADGRGYVVLKIDKGKPSHTDKSAAAGKPKRRRMGEAEAAAEPSSMKKSKSMMSLSDANIITEEEVVNVLKNGPLTVKDLLRFFQQKLRSDARNKPLIQEIIKKVARLENKALVLK
ncbi:transcription factor TFIIF complex alpha subunit Tfg1 [Schizosaccharomyces japonicus yFS275]|uniref:Transcription initiation factor IIF subunit alpha n=1 Tax=Schizosaccharomyces japonicus (strain yFS275 / FY16936) TaxID=402676 RepID=B6JUZ6_SCHJY|nr:transcription factor TFIIF complex alpha subunit Tfg1 [Schizosaccharomyces japonicus yFS275]EEB05100.2 transcription factor TFIIF complex alpha subunit Tfg1 [Schizosaccharomyces japonicus yFS275]